MKLLVALLVLVSLALYLIPEPQNALVITVVKPALAVVATLLVLVYGKVFK